MLAATRKHLARLKDGRYFNGERETAFQTYVGVAFAQMMPSARGDDFDLEDYIQEAALATLLAVDAHIQETPSYTMSSAVYYGAMSHRKSINSKKRTRDRYASGGLAATGEWGEPLYLDDRAERACALEQATRLLNARDAEIITMFLRGCETEEVAVVANLSCQSTTNKKQRIAKKMRGYL